ncbi:polysaccharide deacetylase family protein [Tumebacillus permanentifrigoris]|uniref:Peptidoglycan/xylan/chitin deacetylase (PgdA/CDA1 family) n=1 Tax=Tumebacillus permanentifrigoris TaxID=378543 RepID=A0A316DDU9_9BACL|nr:polysaccharide deacetylase family protein [Tumebacillus permanentifrigoris]PWK14970.1 peptidoglycan/xylan/chitin deacetylase (PgdA/CDA1 family) [Tumebacillus permanentifrigoris]
MKGYIALGIAAMLVAGGLVNSAISHTEQKSSYQLVTAQTQEALQDPTDEELQYAKATYKPRPLVASPPAVEPIAGKVAYLTFDDGPSENTTHVLDTLRNEHIHATFFVIGTSEPHGQDLMKRIVNEGHAIGNHTYSHNYNKIYQNSSAFREDFDRNEALIEQATGVHTTLMRFPGGSNNAVAAQVGGRNIMKKIASEMTHAGFVYFDWNVSSGDAATNKVPALMIAENVLSQAKGKDKIIVLLHDSSSKTTTTEALPTIIQGLRQQGFAFDKVDNQCNSYQFTKP